MTIDDSDGYLDLVVNGGTHRLDLFVANDTLLTALDGHRHGEDPVSDYYDRLKTACVELGLPPLSGQAVSKVKDAVFARMGDLRKKDESPVTTP